MVTKERATTKKKALPAGVRMAKSGRYEKRFTLNGARYSVYGKSIKEVTQKETEKRVAIQAGIYTRNASITLAQYFDEWIAHKASTVSTCTAYYYALQFKNHLRRPLGRFKVSTIERRQLIAVLSNIAKKSSVRTSNTCRSLLAQVFQSAVYDEIISDNIVRKIPAIKEEEKVPARETIHRALTDAEIGAFMRAAGNSQYFHAFEFMLATGVRAGECAALAWGDIDGKGGVIHIRRTITRDKTGKKVIGNQTKTKRSRRDIPINAEISRILTEQRAQNAALFGVQFNPAALVFPASGGQHASAEIFNGTIYRILQGLEKKSSEKSTTGQAAPIRHFSAHAFRDTFASKAAMAGVPLNVLKELLGHSSYAMTADLYGHIYDEQKKAAMNDLKMCVG